MSLEWFVARRYLFSRERNALISADTLISVLGVAVGVAALVVVIGVMDGAYRLLMKQITNITPHVRLEPEDGSDQPLDPVFLENLKKRSDVLRADPILEKQAIIQLPRGAQAQKEGIRLLALDHLGGDASYTFNLPADFKSVDVVTTGIVLDKPLSAKLNAPVGAKVQLLVQTPRAAASAFPFRPYSFRVVGIADTGYYEFDAHIAFINSAALRSIFPQPGPDYISIKVREPSMLANGWKPTPYAQTFKFSHYRMHTWQQEKGEFFASLLIQKYGLFIILLLIILVSAQNIIGTLILMVTEKTREIGILRAVGAGRGFVAKLFLFIGVLIGMVGTGLGLVLGVCIALLVPYAPLKMPEAIYNFERLPMEIRPMTLVSIAAAALIICTLGALIPALQAARLNPAQAVRYD